MTVPPKTLPSGLASETLNLPILHSMFPISVQVYEPVRVKYLKAALHGEGKANWNEEEWKKTLTMVCTA